MKKFYSVLISPAAEGFDNFDFNATYAIAQGWEHKGDLLDEMRRAFDIFELGTDEMSDAPAEVLDIRGRIHNEPDSVYAIFTEDYFVGYEGINED